MDNRISSDISSVEKEIESYSKLHAYSGSAPEGLGSSEINEWLHISKDLKDREENHAELIGDFRHVASSDCDISESPDLIKLNAEQFSVIKLDHVLDYVEWKNQVELLTYLWNLTKPYGEIQIRCRNIASLTKALKESGKIQKIFNPTSSWKTTMQSLYSSGCPSDWFMCWHSKASIKASLQEAGFGNILYKTHSNSELIVHARRQES